MTPSIGMVGAGAIGSGLGDAFDRAGWRVSMIARGATLQSLRAGGLRVAEGSESRVSGARAGSAHELGVQDFVALTVKAQRLPELAPLLSPLIGPSTVLISGANGIPWWFFQDFCGPLANQTLQSVDPTGTHQRTFPRGRTLRSAIHAPARVTSARHVQALA